MHSRLLRVVISLVLACPPCALLAQAQAEVQDTADAAAPAEPVEPTAATPADQAPAKTVAVEPDTPPEPDRGLLPELNVYFPEGELDLRVNRLVKKVFAEGQVKYNFVDGDISAFLRYRYYGFDRTFQLSVFDDISFADIEKFSNDFDRTRGILLLTEWPHSFHRRTFLLSELDRITSNKEEFVFDTGKTNLFFRLGYQIGTPNDERSNSIVGESRARVQHLFTAFRRVGPGDAGLTTALTWGTDAVVGDFDYAKLELSGIKRFDLPRGMALFGRIHAGTFPIKQRLDRDIEADSALPITGRYAIPREEFFRLDGRDNLKGLDEKLRGTDEIHSTWELVYPWFVGQRHKRLGLQWENWYWVLYGGIGNIGFDHEAFTHFGEYIYDAGTGFESSFRLRDFEFFLSGLVAEAFNAEGGVQFRLSIKSYH